MLAKIFAALFHIASPSDVCGRNGANSWYIHGLFSLKLSPQNCGSKSGWRDGGNDILMRRLEEVIKIAVKNLFQSGYWGQSGEIVLWEANPLEKWLAHQNVGEEE